MRKFVSDETHSVAVVHFNDAGIGGSGKIVKKYAERALRVISEGIHNPIRRRELSALVKDISSQADYLISYEERYAEFKRKEVDGIIGKLAKIVVLLKSASEMSYRHSRMSHMMKNAHAEISTEVLKPLGDLPDV